MDKNKPTSEQQNEQDQVFYIVNPAGAVHACDREHAQARFQQRGYRPATPEEVAELQRRHGHQVAGKPIARRE